MEEKTRRGGRGARRKIRLNKIESMLPTLTRGIPYVEVASEDQVERIHKASIDILENVGVDFRDPQALSDWQQAGAKVEGERVYLDGGLIMELIKSIPAEITLHARDKEKTVSLGNGKSIFVPMTGAPFIRDLDGERRWGTLEDLNNFHKLSHLAPAMHSTAHVICEPMDIAVGHRHLWITYSSMKNSDKTFQSVLGWSAIAPKM